VEQGPVSFTLPCFDEFGTCPTIHGKDWLLLVAGQTSSCRGSLTAVELDALFVPVPRVVGATFVTEYVLLYTSKR
jgi:hypothetical protein